VKEREHPAKPPALPSCLACDGPTAEGERTLCPGCGSPYHPACAQQLRGCRTPGCAHAPADALRIEAAPRELSEPRCPYCLSDLARSQVPCPACGARYHPSCALTLGTCATLGCTGELPTRVVERRALGRRLNRTLSRFRTFSEANAYGYGSRPVQLGSPAHPAVGISALAVMVVQIPAWCLAYLVMGLVPRDWKFLAAAVSYLTLGWILPVIAGIVLASSLPSANDEPPG